MIYSFGREFIWTVNSCVPRIRLQIDQRFQMNGWFWFCTRHKLCISVTTSIVLINRLQMDRHIVVTHLWKALNLSLAFKKSFSGNDKKTERSAVRFDNFSIFLPVVLHNHSSVFFCLKVSVFFYRLFSFCWITRLEQHQTQDSLKMPSAFNIDNYLFLNSSFLRTTGSTNSTIVAFENFLFSYMYRFWRATNHIASLEL